MKQGLKKHYYVMIWPALIVVLLDQISKYVLVQTLQLHHSVSVIAGFFNFVHVRNRGMAFGFMNRMGVGFSAWFFAGACLVAIILLLFWFTKLKEEERRIGLALSLIMGEAVGNLIDRVRLGEVIDFLDFYVGSFHWPAFNVADSAITVGTFWVVASLIFKKQK